MNSIAFDRIRSNSIEFDQSWIPGCLDSWIPGFLASWIPRSFDPWIPGFPDPWMHGFLDSWISGSWIPGCLDSSIPGFLVSWSFQHLSQRTPPRRSFPHPGSHIMHEAVVVNIRRPHPHRAADILEAKPTSMKEFVCRHVTHMRECKLHKNNAMNTNRRKAYGDDR